MRRARYWWFWIKPKASREQVTSYAVISTSRAFERSLLCSTESNTYASSCLIHPQIVWQSCVPATLGTLKFYLVNFSY